MNKLPLPTTHIVPSHSLRGTRVAPAEGEMPRRGSNKMHIVMREFKHHALHQGSKRGPIVRNRKQAIAIALSEQRRVHRGR